jgi:hypothetical protein
MATKEPEDLSFLNNVDVHVMDAPTEPLDNAALTTPNQARAVANKPEDLSFLAAADETIAPAASTAEDSSSNPATPLSAAVHGLESGFTYNTADDASSLVDSEAKARFEASAKEYPVTYGLSNLVGAVASPNPIGKIGAIQKAGLFIKTLVGLGKGAAEGTLATLGEAEGSPEQRLSSLGENKLGLAISTAAGPLSMLSKISGKDGEVIVEAGDKALKLGREMQDTIASPEAQQIVARQLDNYAPRLKAAVQGAQDTVEKEMNQIATTNAKIPVKSDFLSKTAGALDAIPDNQLDDATRAAKNRLKSSVERAEMTAALSSADRTSAAGSFEGLYQSKKRLGQEIWKNKVYDKSPEMKAKAIKLYDSMNSALKTADVGPQGTGGKFQEVSDTFFTLYRTGEDAERMTGSVLKSLADPFDTAGKKVKRETFQAYNRLSPKLRERYMPGMDKLVNEELPELVTTARIVRKVTGRMPGEGGKVTQQLSEKIPGLRYFTDAGRLELLNRLGAEEVGSKAKILSGSSDSLSKIGSRSAPTLLTEEEVVVDE